MKNRQNTYCRIREQLLGKKEDGKYFLFLNAKWVPDENHAIMDRLVGSDPSEPEDSPYRFGSGTVFCLDDVPYEKAMQILSDQTVDFLIEKWKKDLVPEKEAWDRNPEWPAKYVKTRFELNGFQYVILPEHLGLSYNCWDQGFMESFQGRMSEDLEAFGAVNIHAIGFLD